MKNYTSALESFNEGQKQDSKYKLAFLTLKYRHTYMLIEDKGDDSP